MLHEIHIAMWPTIRLAGYPFSEKSIWLNEIGFNFYSMHEIVLVYTYQLFGSLVTDSLNDQFSAVVSVFAQLSMQGFRIFKSSLGFYS